MFLPVRKEGLGLLVNQPQNCCCAQPGVLKDTSSVPPASLKPLGDILVSKAKPNSRRAAVALSGCNGSLAAALAGDDGAMGRASRAPIQGRVLGRKAETPHRAGTLAAPSQQCLRHRRRRTEEPEVWGLFWVLLFPTGSGCRELSGAFNHSTAGDRRSRQVIHPASNQPGVSHQNGICQKTAC